MNSSLREVKEAERSVTISTTTTVTFTAKEVSRLLREAAKAPEDAEVTMDDSSLYLDFSIKWTTTEPGE